MYADASVPEATAKKVHGKKKAGKQKENVSRLPLRVQNHELPEEELVSVFGENGWKRLPDKVYLKVEYLPARQECVEHHLLQFMQVDLMEECETGVALDVSAFQTNVLNLSEETKVSLQKQVDAFLKFMEG